MTNPSDPNTRRSGGCLKWIIIAGVLGSVLIIVFIIAIISIVNAAMGSVGMASISYPQGYPNAAAMSTLLPQLQASPFDPSTGYAITAPVQGDPAHFDPIQALPSVADFSGPGSQLISFEARYVRSDGTMDLTATSYHPIATYQFARQVPMPTDAPPVGAGGTLNGNWYEPVQVEVYQPGQGNHVTTGSSEYTYANKGMDRSTERPSSNKVQLAPPATCPIVNFWKVALQKDAPPSAVATVDYNQSGYQFDISDANIHLAFDTQCKLKPAS
ncbi:MAG TPA: hypothetical protein VKQ72_05645 [Aggregatilineales bacterium]|nr:hypothetical protein [Aggregatilineales bacterium]